MPPIRAQAVERIRHDHEHLVEMANRIKNVCTERGVLDNCNDCHPNLRQRCHGNIEQLIRTFVDSTLKHNLIESLLMEDGVPHAHRIAHRRAHIEMADQMKTVRVVLSLDGNCIKAIDGIDDVLKSLESHNEDFDRQLERYLLALA